MFRHSERGRPNRQIELEKVDLSETERDLSEVVDVSKEKDDGSTDKEFVFSERMGSNHSEGDPSDRENDPTELGLLNVSPAQLTK